MAAHDVIEAPAPPGLEQRWELYRRLRAADRQAKIDASRAARSSLDFGALLEALVRDGASLREIGRALGISHTAVDKRLARYRKAIARGEGEVDES